MPDPLDAATLLRSVGLLADGPVVWGRPIPARGPGVFVIELPEPRAAAPVELDRVGKWLERVDTFTLDGIRPTSKAIAARLASYWLPSQSVLYVGATEGSLPGRVAAMAATTLGDRRPTAAGHWLHTLRVLPSARVWWATTTAVEEYEDALLSGFAAGLTEADRAMRAERARLVDDDPILPFANLRRPTGERRRSGLAGTLLAEPVEPPRPSTRVVQLPDGDADGARGEPAVKRPRSRPVRVALSATSPVRPPVAAPEEARLEDRPGHPRTRRVELTADGIARLQAELSVLTKEKRPEVIGRIRAAKELGDLKENADYTAAREEQSFLEGRVQAIESQLRDAVMIQAPAAGSRVGLGSVVTIETEGEQLRFEIVGTTESSPKDGRISGASPVGRAVLGSSVGDDVTVQSPGGPIRYRIVQVD